MGMTVTLGHALAVVAVSAAILLVIAVLAARSTTTTHPTYCAHCWAHRRKRTVIALSEQKHQWGICNECVEFYWQFEDEE